MKCSFILGPQKSKRLLLIHGFLGSSEDFFPLAERLSTDYCCLGIDLPRHGSKKNIPCKSLEEEALFIVEVCKFYNCKNVLGYSMGGRLAMLAHFFSPNFFQRIAILSSHYGLTTREKKRRKTQDDFWINLLKTSPCKFIETWYAQKIFEGFNPSYLMDSRKSNRPEDMAEVLSKWTLSRQTNLWSHIHCYKQTFLFLHGEMDEKYKKLYKNLPHKVFSIPNASHAVHFQNLSEVEKKVRAFFI